MANNTIFYTDELHLFVKAESDDKKEPVSEQSNTPALERAAVATLPRETAASMPLATPLATLAESEISGYRGESVTTYEQNPSAQVKKEPIEIVAVSNTHHGQSPHRNISIARARSTMKKRPSDALDDDAYGAWEKEPAADRFDRVLHLYQEQGIVKLKCGCVSCNPREPGQPHVSSVPDQDGKPHQCRIGEIVTIEVLCPEFERRIWPSPEVAKADTMMPYSSNSAKPKNTFLGQLTRRGFTWITDRSTEYPIFYQWSRRVADHQRDNVLSPKAKAKKPHCGGQLNDAPLSHPHRSIAVAAPLPVATLPPAAAAAGTAAAAALLQAEAIDDDDVVVVEGFFADTAPAGYETLADVEVGLQSASRCALQVSAGGLGPGPEADGLEEALSVPGLGRSDRLHGPARAAAAATAGLEDEQLGCEEAGEWSGWDLPLA